ncbi:MAG TPA: ABC transporter permease [Chloroflexota bacterium]|nr:ABC transporter permease [Chloroflexota bacterium]
MLSTPIRTTAPANVFLGELLRQPWLLFIVIFGPFLILLAFVLGARVYRDFPTTIVVLPPSAAQDTPLQMGAQDLDNYLRVVDTTTDREAALERLRRGEVKLVLELPADPRAALARGQRAQVRLTTNEIDPLANSFFTLFVESQIAELNRQAIARVIGEGRGSSADVQAQVTRLQQALDGIENGSVADQRRRLRETATALAQLDATLGQIEEVAQLTGLLGAGPGSPLGELRAQRERLRGFYADLQQLDQQLNAVPSPAEAARLRQQLGQVQTLLAQLQTANPDVLSAPFYAEIQNVAPYQPEGTTYFLPGILALILQHLAVTLAAVSIARDRRLGVLDLYRLSPASAAEVLVGKYLGLSLMVALIAAAVTALALLALHVPVLAGLGWLVAVLFVFLLVALALGFVIGLLTRSEQAAIQACMLLLIASVAFGGLLAPLDQLTPPMLVVAYLLPVTTGRLLLETVLFRGAPLDWAAVHWIAPATLAGLLLVLLALSFRLFAGELARRR